jgi:hypothetical protein
MSEEIGNSAQRRRQPADNGSADAELRELRLSARALRERLERVEAQLQRAKEVTGKARNVGWSKGKVSTPPG